MGANAHNDFDSLDDHLNEEAIEHLETSDSSLIENQIDDQIDPDIQDQLDDLLAMDDAAPPSKTTAPKLAETEHRYEGPDRRGSVVDTRSSGLERRRGPGRRLTDFVKAAEEGEMNAEQFLFLKAIDTFKTANNKSYPNWTDVLEVVRLLGYRKTLASELNLAGTDDWKEKPDAPSNVRTRDGITHKRKAA
ncbi:MAG: hypothetical protein COB69_08415 [Phycisphaera sp.]|nr:MAG: hypothetical protein COB69_08415 [Phycisphaera sp.]